MNKVMKIVPNIMMPTVNTLFNMAAQLFTAITTLYYGVILGAGTADSSYLCLTIFILYYLLAFVLVLVLDCMVARNKKNSNKQRESARKVLGSMTVSN